MEKFFYFLQVILDFLVPESERIEKMMRMPSWKLKNRLPKPRQTEDRNAEALFDYRDEWVRLLIKAIKYRGNIGVTKRMAEYLNEEIMEFTSETYLFDAGNDIIVVPMPISPKRKKERGWSQCELLCKELQKISGEKPKYRFDVLYKIKETKKQTDLSRKDRLQNVKESMIAKNVPAKATVIVIDDVYTTGATFFESRRALLASGAGKVVGFFLAH